MGFSFIDSQGNILMDDEDHVRITDFGFALIAEATPGHFGSVHGGAAIHFTAPELFDAADFGLDNTRPTVATDVYALACTCVELYGDKWPWEGTEKLNNFQIGNKVSKGQRPKRPTTPYGEPMPASIWDVVCACWKQRPSDRLKVSPLVKQLEAIAFA
ncbi:hypothetical protein EUX98_g5009 [Antrodiella citrinella]|uniref:Protein kinase domain-containing protein n=1 Tax=Antrodiella citrinella TaxID=2447956 RepID=A0A4S4MSL0_9APHY|nr:hypothetical protein EUX98_g5009 [Antrodiella citrinella]